MPNDPIERWEWEGGALAVDARAATGESRGEARAQPAEPAAPRFGDVADTPSEQRHSGWGDRPGPMG